jgi:hypothetical protein
LLNRGMNGCMDADILSLWQLYFSS